MKEMIGIIETSVYFPPGIETAADISRKTNIPEEVIVHKFGLRKKHVADAALHATDMAIEAARPIFEVVNPSDVDVIIYFGSPYKDYNVWSGVTKIQHHLQAHHAYVFEMMNVSSCFPIALKVAKDMLVADTTIKNILLVGGSKESHIVDYHNPRSRFMFNFADGGAAALLHRGVVRNQVLGSCFITDGSFYDDVKVAAGGSVHASSKKPLDHQAYAIDVKDPQDMKRRLDVVSEQNFVKVIHGALERSGYGVEDIDVLLPLHTKRSIFTNVIEKLGLDERQAIYLEEHGHLSALDPCIGLHFARQRGLIQNGSVVVTVSAGTGYTWSATVMKYE